MKTKTILQIIIAVTVFSYLQINSFGKLNGETTIVSPRDPAFIFEKNDSPVPPGSLFL